MLGKVPDNRWVPNDSLIRDDCQDEARHVVSKKVLDDYWVPNDPLVPKDPFIHDDH